MIQSKKKKKKLNPMLINVLIISGAAHILALLILGGITVVKYIIPDDAEFEEPPAIEEVEAPKEVQVDIKPPPPTPQKQMGKLQMRPMANIAVSSVNVDLPNMDQSFTVSAGVGELGGNLMGGSHGAMNIGMSNLNVFGLKSKGEKVLFVIDAGEEMLFDSKGGINSYNTIKDEITSMVGNLSAGTLFNVMLFDWNGYSLFKPQLVASGTSITSELEQWIAPINSSIKNAGSIPNKKLLDAKAELEGFERFYAGIKQHIYQDNSRTQKLLEMKVDAIFYITGRHSGYTNFRLGYLPKELEALKTKFAQEQELNKTDPDRIALIQARKAEEAELLKTVKKKLATLNEQRAAKGIPPKVIGGHLPSQMKFFGLSYKTAEPPPTGLHIPPHSLARENDTRKYFKRLTKKLYLDLGDRPPSINIILFLAKDEEYPANIEKSVKQLVRDFNGKMKIIRGLSQIKSSAQSSQVAN